MCVFLFSFYKANEYVSETTLPFNILPEGSETHITGGDNIIDTEVKVGVVGTGFTGFFFVQGVVAQLTARRSGVLLTKRQKMKALTVVETLEYTPDPNFASTCVWQIL